MAQASFSARSWPVKDRTVRARTGGKTGRSGLQFPARENVGPVRSLTEPLGQTEKTQSPPAPFLVIAAIGSARVNHRVLELPLFILPLHPMRRGLLPLLAIVVVRALLPIWSSRASTMASTQRNGNCGRAIPRPRAEIVPSHDLPQRPHLTNLKLR